MVRENFFVDVENCYSPINPFVSPPTGPGWGPVRVGARSGLGPIWAHMGPYGPIYGPMWAHMGPYGPMWAHMGPYGPSWTGLGDSVNFPSDFRQLSVRQFGPISHVSGPKMVF